MCFVEVIDTAGQGTTLAPKISSLLCSPIIKRSTQLYATSGCGELWDESYMSMLFPHHFSSEGQGFILVYSIASRATFDRLDVFRQSMMRVKRQKPIFMLVGNKCDKGYEREVSREEGQALARQFGCDFLETSAKTAQNVERLFTSLVRMLRNTKQTEQALATPGRPLEKEKKRKCIIM